MNFFLLLTTSDGSDDGGGLALRWATHICLFIYQFIRDAVASGDINQQHVKEAQNIVTVIKYCE